MSKANPYAMSLLLVALLSAPAMAQASQSNDGQEHHSRFSKLAVWRHHKDSKDMKGNAKPVAQSQRAQAQVAPARPVQVKHISDLDMPDEAQNSHHAQKTASPVKMAAKKEPASASHSAKRPVHHAAKKADEKSAAHANTAHKKAASKEKKSAAASESGASNL